MTKYKIVFDKDGNVVEKGPMTQEEIDNPAPNAVDISPIDFWKSMLAMGDLPQTTTDIVKLRIKMLEEPENLTDDEKKRIKEIEGEE